MSDDEFYKNCVKPDPDDWRARPMFGSPPVRRSPSRSPKPDEIPCPCDDMDLENGSPDSRSAGEIAGGEANQDMDLKYGSDDERKSETNNYNDYDVLPPPPPPPLRSPGREIIVKGTSETITDDLRNDEKNRHGDDDDDGHRRRRRHRHRDHRRQRDDNDDDVGDRDGNLDDDDKADDARYTKDSTTPDYNKTTNSTNMIYVTNISQTATLEQLTTLFGFLGEILDIVMYDYDTSPETNFKVCFIKYAQHSSVLMAQHLTNTVFIDRALFVLPYKRLAVPPTKEIATELGYGESEYVSRLNSGIVTQVATGPGGTQIITTTDPRLAALGLQTYPQLPIHTDPTRIEEIRRTLYIGNLDSSLSPETVIKFFNDIGEVKYIRIAGDDTQPTRFAFVEFTHQASIANALQHNGFILGSRALKMNHSNNPIVKPPIKLDINDSLKKRDRHSSSREFGPREAGKYQSSSRHDRSRDRPRGYDRHRYNDRRVSPRDSRSTSRRSRSRDRSRRSRSRDYPSRRSRSRDEFPRRRSRSRDSRKRKSRSRSSDRKSKHKSSRRH